MTAVVGAGAAVGVARIASLVCAVIQLPLLTSVLTPAEYSLVALTIAGSTYFSLIAADPITLAFQRFPGERTDRGAYRYALVRVAVSLGALGLLTIAISLILGLWQVAIAVVGWGAGLATTRLISMAWLMWAEPWKYSANLILSTGVRTAAVVWLVHAGVEGALAVGIAGFASAVAALVVSPRFPRVSRLPKAPWSWRFGVHLALASLAGTILTSAGLLMLPLFVDGTAVGRFAAMNQLATLTCGSVLGLVLTVAYPALRRVWDGGAHDASSARIEWLTTVCLVVCLATIGVFSAGSYWLPARAVGENYLDADILPLLVLSTGFASMGQLASWYHQFRLEAPTVSRRTWLSAVFGIAVTAVGAWCYGIVGASIGVALGFLAYFLVLRIGTRLSRLAAFAAGVTFVLSVAGAIAPGGSALDLSTGMLSAAFALALTARLVWQLTQHREALR